MPESLKNYLSKSLPRGVGRSQYLRLFATVFALVFAGSVLLHVLLGERSSVSHLLVHAASIAGGYTVIVGLACALIYATRRTIERIRVWHVWMASFTVFVVGYYLQPLGDVTNAHSSAVSIFQLLPAWALVTFFFVHPYLSESRVTELDRLREMNAILEAGIPQGDDATQAIRFQSGKTGFVLEAGSIRNVAVDDHYCYVHYRQGEGYAKRDLAMPLRDVLALLPPGFVQVHRSHIVNLGYIRSIRRSNRNLRIVLDGDFEAPVSRHRLDDVLPLLRRQLSLNERS